MPSPHFLILHRHLPTWRKFAPYAPVLAFFAGFIWDAWTLGRGVKATDFWQLGGMLLGSAGIILWLARRVDQPKPQPWERNNLKEKLRWVYWQAPYLLLQFFYGGMFSALFILYFKSTGHLGTALTAALLGGLLVANELMGRHYAQHFSLTWTLFGLNAILLMNFVLPYLVGSLHPLWFYLSTALGLLLTYLVYAFAPGKPGRLWPVAVLALALMLAWRADMIAPVPLVKRELAIGQQFTIADKQYQLQVERAPWWQFWRARSDTIHLPAGEKIYGISAVFAPRGVSALLEHRWERQDHLGEWKTVGTVRFEAKGGRDQGFRGYSWLANPAPGQWRLVVATQDGRTIAIEKFALAHRLPDPERLEMRHY